jgi:succinoglycan biosynthesis protein ExoM
MSSLVRVDVGVCTFRRESVAATLRSLGAQTLRPTIRMRVVVADNEPTPAAEARVRAAAEACGLDLAYVHAPANNICIARNAILDALAGDYLAFIDDDQLAAPDWIARLTEAIERQGCDAVLGPVRAVYPAEAPAWVAAGDFLSFQPVRVGGRILKGYTCNALIRSDSIRRHGLRFDLSLGRSGGEDDAFFYQLTDAGGVIGYAADAHVSEPAALSRTSLGFLLKRNFRFGQSHGRRQARAFLPIRIAQIGLATAKGVLCLAAAAATAPSPVRRRQWLVRGALHAGAAARLAGLKELQLYAADTATAAHRK